MLLWGFLKFIIVKAYYMIFTILIIYLVGLYISSSKKLGLLNPFQVYFGIWSLIFIFYSLAKTTYIKISFEYELTIISVGCFALISLLGVKLMSSRKSLNRPTKNVNINYKL